MTMDSETGEYTDLQADPKKKSRKSCTTSPKFVYILTIFAALGGFQFGYDTGVVSGSMLLISKHFRLSTLWIEAIVSGTVATSIICSILGGHLSDHTGRRPTIMAASFIFTLGAIVMSAAPSKEILLVGRLLLGIAVGFTSVTVPVYVAEVAPPDIRGSLGTVNNLFITVGILVSSLVAGSFSQSRDNGWRYMLGMGVLPGIFQFIGFLFLPETPRWLMNNGLEHKAHDVILQIHGTSGFEEEVTSLKETLEESKILASETPGSTLWRVLRTPHVCRALFVGAGLQFFSQLCGVNTVMYYSAMMMQMAGYSVSKSIWLSVVPTALQLVSAGMGVVLMDRLGRRMILLLSLAGRGLIYVHVFLRNLLC